MKMKIKSTLSLLTMAALCAIKTSAATPLGTGFTYQGRLNDAGAPANGNYDMIFNLYDAPTNGNVLGSFSIYGAVPVTNGLFTLELNSYGEFGTNAFNGQARWLQIGVRTNNNNAMNPWVNLWPRQPLDPAPHAFYALNASNSVNASFASTVADSSITSSKLAPGAVTWSSIAGIPAGFADGIDNGTNYAAGPGLTLSGANNQFSVNFAGTGAATTAARSDHNHFGAVWGGNVSYGLGLSVSNAAANGAGLYGQQGTGSGFPYIFGNTAGVWGESSQGSGVYGASGYTNGSGVFGFAASTNGANHGVEGVTSSSSGSGVYGRQGTGSGAFPSGLASGIWGDSSDSHGVAGTTKSGNSAYGVMGISTATTGTGGGVYGESHSPNGKAVYGYSVANTGISSGIYGLTYSSNGFGIYGRNGASPANAYRPDGNGAAVYGESQFDTGVAGISDSEVGVFGSSISGPGVSAYSQNASGVSAQSDSWVGVWASSSGLAATIAFGTASADGVWASSDSGEAVKRSAPPVSGFMLIAVRTAPSKRGLT
jgi:hypothetical protein